jgi:hypothetical protein
MSGKTASTGCGSSIETSPQRGYTPIRLPGPIPVPMGFREIRERNGDKSVLRVSTTNCSTQAAGLSLGCRGNEPACLAPCYSRSDHDVVLGTLPTATRSGELLVERPSPGQS